MTKDNAAQGVEESLATLESRFETLGGYGDALSEELERNSQHLTLPHTGMLLEYLLDVLDAIWRICRTLDETSHERLRKTLDRTLLEPALVDLAYGIDGVMVARHLIGRARGTLLEIERGTHESSPGQDTPQGEP